MNNEHTMTNEEAIKILSNATFSEEWQGNEELTTAYLMAIEALKNEKPHGEWIGEHFVYKCSKCEHIADSVLSVTGRNIIPMLSNYCPECGAYMKEADNDR